MMVNEEQVTDAPEVIEVLDRLRSAALVPTEPIAMFVVASDFWRTKYPAVPVLPAVPPVIALAVAVTTREPAEPDAAGVPNAVAPKVSVASNVPVMAWFASAGCEPV